MSQPAEEFSQEMLFDPSEKWIAQQLFSFKRMEKLAEGLNRNAGVDIDTPHAQQLLYCRQAILDALSMLEDVHRELFQLFYIKRLPWQCVCIEAHCSRATFYKRKTELLHEVHHCMEMLEPRLWKIA